MPDSPKQAFDRYLDRVERDPAWQARQERIRRAKGGRQFRWSPGAGFIVIGLVLAGYAVARAFGWSP